MGNLQGNAAAGVIALLDTIGGSAVRSTSGASGAAAGRGETGKAVAWGSASVGLIAVNAVTFGRMGGVKRLAAQFQGGIKNVGLYELGAMTYPRATFQTVSHLGSNAARGASLLQKFGTVGKVLGQAARATLKDRLVTLFTGGTPLAYLTLQIPGTVAANLYTPDTVEYLEGLHLEYLNFSSEGPNK